jgi:hypothetical protein
MRASWRSGRPAYLCGRRDGPGNRPGQSDQCFQPSRVRDRRRRVPCLGPILPGHVSGTDRALNRLSCRGAAEAEPSRNRGQACATAGPRGIDWRCASSYDHAAWALLLPGSLGFSPSRSVIARPPGNCLSEAPKANLEASRPSCRSRQPRRSEAKKLVGPY